MKVHQRSNHPLHVMRHHVRKVFYASTLRQFKARLLRLKAQGSSAPIADTFVDFPLRRYLDNRWSVQQRFEHCARDLEILLNKMGHAHFDALLNHKPIRLLNLHIFSVCLELNTISPHDGFWALALRDTAGKLVYNLSFGFLGEETLLIGSLQGSKSPDGQVRNIYKFITKISMGLRPQNLLVFALRALCVTWKVNHLYGIDPQFIGPKGLMPRPSPVKFQYINFWHELGAEKNEQGYWRIPLHTPPTEVAQSAPSPKKHRERAYLFDKLTEHCTCLFGHQTHKGAKPQGNSTALFMPFCQTAVSKYERLLIHS